MTNIDSTNNEKSLSFTEKYYFSSYDHFGIHEEMLKDKTRTLSYRSAMYKNRALFKDKIVLDVGCGTGILSMFAVNAGASHVYSVDMSNIIYKAKEIITLNGFENKITLIKGKIEDIVLPIEKVDIIISEWMGYFLLYESMLDSIIFARDKYLVEGGLILPDKCSMYIAGIEDGQYKNDKFCFWEDVYGFDFSPFIEVVMTEPVIDHVEKKALITTSCKFFEFDINTISKKDLSFSCNFKLNAIDNDFCHAYIVWWEAKFPGPEKIILSTSPWDNYTHWKQTIFYMDKTLNVKKGDAINGTISSKPNSKNPREIDIDISWNTESNSQNRLLKESGSFSYLMR